MKDEKRCYSYIIDEVCPRTKSRELVRKIIPILVRWAKQGLTNRTYNDLIQELGYTKYSGIGKPLGYVKDVFEKFKEETKEEVPTLNALVKSKSNNLPSEGFSYVCPQYDEMSLNSKITYVTGLNTAAKEYKNWDWVLTALDLTPSFIDSESDEIKIRSGKFFGSKGEGEEHKKIKEYIYNNPDAIGIENVIQKETEYILLSADRLDLYFKLKNGGNIAVEVKPQTSPDDDIMRGLYQCVKYKAIMDAEDKVHGNKVNNKCILVIGGFLSESNKQIRDVLNIYVIEGFKQK